MQTNYIQMKNIGFISFPQRMLTLLLLILILLAGRVAFGQINISGSSPFVYTENFNSFAGSSATAGMPTGWAQSGSSVYKGQGTGSSNAGGVWSYGTSGDWSLGALYSGSTSITTYTATFKNTSGYTITGLTVSYDFEGWRNGGGNTGGITVTSSGVTIGTALDATYAAGTTNKTTGALTVSIANNATFTFAFKNVDGSGSDNGVSLDNFSLTATYSIPCTTADALAFQVQPSNVVQDANMTAVKVKAICTAGGGTATSYTGPITLTLNTPGCGYTAQTVNAVAGVATFSSVAISRSAQTGINFTATASGLTSATSSNFNVTTPAGTATTTVVTQNNFDATTTWAYTVGTPSYAGSGSGNDVTGTKSNGGSNVLCKSFSVDNGSGDRGSTNTVTFNNVTGLSTYDQLDFEFKVVSFGSGSGAGNDSGEDFFLQVSTNGGSSWTTILTEIGSSNRLFALASSPVTSLSLANSSYSSGDSKSAFKLSLTGISQFQFRFTAENNRTNENWGIDDVKLTGTSHTSGTPFNLPTATASAAAAICNTADGIQLGVNVTSFQAPLAYSWTPTPTLDVATVQNPVAYLTAASQIYSVTVTDGDNCKATATVSVNNAGFGGTAGLWTGTQSTDWFDCRNWSDRNVPDASTNVVIRQTATNACVIDEFDAVCSSLTISTTGTARNLTLTSTGTLTVTNDVSITKTAGSNNIQLALQDNSVLTCRNLTIDGFNSDGDAKLKHEETGTLVVVNGNVTIQPFGELDLSDGNVNAPDGMMHVKGNFTNNAGEDDFKQDESTIVFNGTGNQTIALTVGGTEIFYNIVVDKTSGTLLFSNDIRIENQLTMTAGNINTQTSLLELGASTSVKGTLSYTSGFVLGKMKRWFSGTNSGNASSLFPMGYDNGGIKNRHVSVEYTSAPTAGSLTVQFKPVNMGMGGIPILSANSGGAGFDVMSTEDQGYWQIDNTNLANGVYRITCTGEGFGTITDISKLTLLKRVGAGNWLCPGTHIAAIGSTSKPVVSRSGLTGWSNFGFGGGIINPLPVELTSFTASCGDKTVLRWSTASENNSDYFAVEKTTDGLHWNEIAQIPSAGNTSHVTNYSYEDQSRDANPVYYRLTQFDFDGASKTYQPISADCDTEFDINLYPNPNDGNFSVALNAKDLKGKINISLASADGRIISQKEIDAVNGSSLVEFGEMLHPGVYFVAVSHENEVLKTIRMAVR